MIPQTLITARSSRTLTRLNILSQSDDRERGCKSLQQEIMYFFKTITVTKKQSQSAFNLLVVSSSTSLQVYCTFLQTFWMLLVFSCHHIAIFCFSHAILLLLFTCLCSFWTEFNTNIKKKTDRFVSVGHNVNDACLLLSRDAQ